VVVRWTFEDQATLETYTFDVNPKEDDTPGYSKNFKFTNTSAPDGKVLVFEGRDQPREGGFSGTVLTEAHFNALHTWWDKRNQILLTDDLGRSYSIIIKSFRPKRRRSQNYPWRHDYEVDYVVVDW
jgi:hypothetical protein